MQFSTARGERGDVRARLGELLPMANWMYDPDELLAAWGFADVGVILSRHANGLEALALLSRRERHGELIRLADGVRVRASVFAALTDARRVLLRIIATALTWTVGGVVSHESAAAVHELALLRSNTGVVHTIVPVASGDAPPEMCVVTRSCCTRTRSTRSKDFG